ncbi:MAG: AMP-binding protein [Candidatus Aminicenantes bacterium]|nr:AMP-binding protein [Candidatus Aminicenantes bacterium]
MKKQKVEKRKHTIIRPSRGWYVIPEWLEKTVDEFPDNEAVKIKRNKSWFTLTYYQLYKKVLAAAYLLRKEGIGKGDSVGILGENSPEWIISFFATSYSGASVVPIDSRLEPSEYRHIIREAGLRGIFASDRFIPEIKELSLEKSFRIYPFSSLLDLEEARVPFPDINLEDEAILMFSSGTTGVSKGIVLVQRNIAANLDAFYQTFEFIPGDIFFLILPLHHSFPITTSLLAPVSVGATIAIARSFKPNELREDLLEVQPHEMMVVPLILEKLIRGVLQKVEKSPLPTRVLFKSMKLSSKIIGGKVSFKTLRKKMGFGRMKYLVSGGAALPGWISEILEEMGFPILQGYGLAETAPVVSVNPPCCPRNKSVGWPLPYVEVRIFDPDEEGIGEIGVRGPNVMKGYYKDAERNKKVFTEDRFFLTGDMGYIDDDGYIYISGRKKFVIVTKGGKNIYPEEVEEALLRSDFVKEVLVISTNNPTTGAEELQAIVYPDFDLVYETLEKQGKQVSEDKIYELIGSEIKKYSQDLADYKRVRSFVIRDEEFPKTTSQKIKRHLFYGEAKRV